MKFLDAVKLAEMNSHLIGKSNDGERIDEIIIYPTDPNLCHEFKKRYILTMNPQEAIVEFINFDVQVGIVTNKFLIEENGVFQYSDLSSLEAELGAILKLT